MAITQSNITYILFQILLKQFNALFVRFFSLQKLHINFTAQSAREYTKGISEKGKTPPTSVLDIMTLNNLMVGLQ